MDCWARPVANWGGLVSRMDPSRGLLLIGLEDHLEQDVPGPRFDPGTLRPGLKELVADFGTTRVLVRSVGPCQSGGSEAYASRAPIDLVPLPDFNGPLGLLKVIWRVWRTCWRSCRGASLVVIPVPGFATLPLWMAARVRRIPILALVVGDAAAVPASVGWPRMQSLTRQLARYQVASARAAWYVTEHTLQKEYPHPGPMLGAASVRVGPHWYEAPRRRVPGQPLQIAFVGSLEQPYKGLHVLLEALVGLSSEIEWRLDVVGEGRQRTELMEMAERLSLSTHIHWHGSIPHDAVRQVVQQAELFVLPSLTEGLPRALVEAMAAGAACIASRVGGVPELLPDSAIVPPGDSVALARMIGRIADDEPFRYALAVQCAERSLDFSPERLERRREEFLVTLCQTLHRTGI